jgi:hypothetical protein
MSASAKPESGLRTIGKGSFASVSVLTGRPVAFKHVHTPASNHELQNEFKALRVLHNKLGNDNFFAIPRPLAFYDPDEPDRFLSTEAFVPWRNRRRPVDLHVAECDMKLLNFDTAAYAMDYVPPLPLTTARSIRELFYPPNTLQAPDPSLCRLYFGKVIQEAKQPKHFFNSANFPLDVARYRALLESAQGGDCEYPSMEEIAYGMGEMLGQLHWRAGYDGRDVEFVMGGASFSGVAMFIIDFNQVSHNL